MKKLILGGLILPLTLFSCSLFDTSSATSNDTSFNTESQTSETSENTSSSTSSVSSSSSSSSKVPEEEYEYFRIEPVVSEDGETLTVYNVSYKNGEYIAYELKTMYRDEDYIEKGDVALYYLGFNEFPPNYFSNRRVAASYGKDGRYYQVYYKGDYTGPNSYTEYLGDFNISDGAYFELDISLNIGGSYNDGSGIDRGAERLVIVEDGITDYGSDPVCYYTDNHYDSFQEFGNYLDSWGEEFCGVRRSEGYYPLRETLPTVDYQVL